MAEAKRPRKVKHGRQGYTPEEVERHLDRLKNATIELLAEGYRPRGIDFGGAWPYSDGSYHLAAHIELDITNWQQEDLRRWVDFAALHLWKYTIGRQGRDSENVTMTVWI